VEVKSISRRVSRAMIKGAATAQKAAANLIASTRRVVPFNYMRGGHPQPELPTAHQTPHSQPSQGLCGCFFFFLFLATRENFSILHVAQKKKAFPQQRLRIEASSLLLFVEFSLSRGILTEKNIFEIIHFKKLYNFALCINKYNYSRFFLYTLGIVYDEINT